MQEPSYLPEGKQYNTYEDGFMNTMKVHVDLSKSKSQMKDLKEFIEWKRAFSKQ